jgi:ATP-dependent helicase/DNAse subunit B
MLLIGPPGSGKTHHILETVRGLIRSGRGRFRLLVPTATMAEHFRNMLAREGLVFRSSAVSTLAKFVEPWATGLGPLSGAQLDRLIKDSLIRVSPRVFHGVAEFPGFRAAIARTLEDLASAGCSAERMEAALGPDAGRHAAAFIAVYRDVERTATSQSLALRGPRLSVAAERIREGGLGGIDEILLDGFFSFTDPELGVIDALVRHAAVTVTLPGWQGAEISRQRLAGMGLVEKRCDGAKRRPATLLVKAQTGDREVQAIASLILEETRRGRPFREMGIVVRRADPQVPALRAALERFGIPARFYFSDPLGDHPLARQFAEAMGALPGGWEHPSRLAAQRPAPRDPATHEMAAISRGYAEAGRDLDRAVSETAAAMPRQKELSRNPTGETACPTDLEVLRAQRGTDASVCRFGSPSDFLTAPKIPSPEFWRDLADALRLTPLRIPDRRRNVVHVMDVYEARQWELPVILVCGLLERQFPVHHPQDPLMGDDLRRKLQRQGIRLSTSAERDREESFLFDLATTRATERLVLSYAQFNEKGGETLRSFCLDRFLETAGPIAEMAAGEIRPEPRGARPLARRAVLRDEALIQTVARQHLRTSPTAIESFLQCPFQFFGRETLRLEPPPLAPEKRLDLRVQGEIVHEVLRQWLRTRRPPAELLDDVFRDACRREDVPEGYRAEAVRLEMLRNLQRFSSAVTLEGMRPEEAEDKYLLPLSDDVTLGCRMDRIDVTPDGLALIVDYKYSGRERIKKLVKGHDEGRNVQGGIYMLALAEAGRACAGMLFAGFRKETTWDGWHTLDTGIGRGRKYTAEELRAVMDRSREAVLTAIARIGQGIIAPDPADAEQCRHCEFHDICRVETAVRTAAAGEAEE